MTCIRKLASFPNTRERPRKPTQSSSTYQVDALVAAAGPVDPTAITITSANIGQQTQNGNTILAAPNSDRTYLTLRNLSPSENLVYSYKPVGEADDPNMDDNGMILRAGDSADLEDIDSVYYVRSLGAADVDCRIDEGEG